MLLLLESRLKRDRSHGTQLRQLIESLSALSVVNPFQSAPKLRFGELKYRA